MIQEPRLVVPRTRQLRLSRRVQMAGRAERRDRQRLPSVLTNAQRTKHQQTTDVRSCDRSSCNTSCRSGSRHERWVWDFLRRIRKKRSHHLTSSTRTRILKPSQLIPQLRVQIRVLSEVSFVKFFQLSDWPARLCLRLAQTSPVASLVKRRLAGFHYL